MSEKTEDGDLTIAEIESYCQIRQNTFRCKLISIAKKDSQSGAQKNLYKFEDGIPRADIPPKPLLKEVKSDAEANTVKQEQTGKSIFLFDKKVFVKDDDDSIKEKRILGFQTKTS